MSSRRPVSRLRLLGAGIAIALVRFGAAEAAEPSLFSPRPDPITRICGGRCAPTVYAGPGLEAPMAFASFDSFSNGRPGARRGLPAGPRPRAFDAVEGTPLDPLLNTTYDLNSPKTVPSLHLP